MVGLLENFRPACAKPLRRRQGGTFNGKLHHKKGNHFIYLLLGKVGKIIMTAFRKFGRRLTVPGLNPNRTNFFTVSQASPRCKPRGCGHVL